MEKNIYECNKRITPRKIINSNNIFVEFLSPQSISIKKRLIKKEILDFSSSGLSFKLDLDEELLFPNTVLNRLRIFSSDKCLLKTSGYIKHIYYSISESGEPYYKIGIKFIKRKTASEKKKDQNILTKEEIELNIYSIINNRHNVLIKIGEGETTYKGVVTSLDNKENILAITALDAANLSDSNNCYDMVTIYYSLNGDTYSFQSVLLNASVTSLKITFPKLIKRLWRRTTLRYCPARDEDIKLIMEHPLIKRGLLNYPVLDITPTGLSFKVDYFNHLFIEGMTIYDIQLSIEGREVNIGNAEVRYIECMFENGKISYYKCGLSFHQIRETEKDIIIDYLFRKNFPNLKECKGREKEFKELWDFYNKSGFIYKEKAEFLSPFKEELFDTFLKLINPDSSFHKNFIFKENEDIYASVSALRAYENTWLIQHLAALKYHNEFLSKHINLSMADFCSKDPEVLYQKIYWRPQNSWSDKIFGRFAKGIKDKNASHLTLYNYLALSSDNYNNISIKEDNKDIKIEPLKRAYYKFIEAFFIKRGEFIILKADSLLRDQIKLPIITKLYREQGLKRVRKIFVAFYHNRFIGILIIEDSSLLLNLAGLLNCFKIYIDRTGNEGIEDEVKRVLIKKAVAYYIKKGRKIIIGLTEDEDISVYNEFGFKKKKEYRCWTFHKSLAHPYYNFVDTIYRRLEKRRAYGKKI